MYHSLAPPPPLLLPLTHPKTKLYNSQQESRSKAEAKEFGFGTQHRKNKLSHEINIMHRHTLRFGPLLSRSLFQASILCSTIFSFFTLTILYVLLHVDKVAAEQQQCSVIQSEPNHQWLTASNSFHSHYYTALLNAVVVMMTTMVMKMVPV